MGWTFLDDLSFQRSAKRIDDVRLMREDQFGEDAGSMAHPIRPPSYEKMDNFYTSTVYEKGAEVIRMVRCPGHHLDHRNIHLPLTP